MEKNCARGSNLVKTFTLDGAPVRAVDDVSLRIQRANSWHWSAPAIRKTTLLSILAALLGSNIGEVLIDGQALSGMDEANACGSAARALVSLFNPITSSRTSRPGECRAHAAFEWNRGRIPANYPCLCSPAWTLIT